MVTEDRDPPNGMVPYTGKDLARPTSMLTRRALALAGQLTRGGQVLVHSSLPETLVLDCGEGAKMDFALVKPGEITLAWGEDFDVFTGDTEDDYEEPDRVKVLLTLKWASQPPRVVRITRPFYISRSAVNPDQWSAVNGGTDKRRGAGIGHRGAPHQRAAEEATWSAARQLAKTLSSKSGYSVALPTEAQWLMAPRKPAIESGATNLEEWCLDAFSNDLRLIPSDGSPCLDGGGVVRVVRGGDLNSSAKQCKSRSRRYGWSYSGFPDVSPRRTTSVCEDEGVPYIGLRAVADVRSHQVPQSELVIDCGHGIPLRFQLVPAGRFVRKPERRSGRIIGKEVEVHIPRPLYIGICPITRLQWAAIMGYDFVDREQARRTGVAGSIRQQPQPNEPFVFRASEEKWQKSQEFCRRLSGQTDLSIRLPSEAEWEYACRAGSETRYHFGDDPARLGDYAWFGGNVTYTGDPDPCYGQLGVPAMQPVGLKQPNAWGLHDTHGCVWELCSDRWHRSLSDAPTDGSARIDGPLRVVRRPDDLRRSYRHKADEAAVRLVINVDPGVGL